MGPQECSQCPRAESIFFGNAGEHGTQAFVNGRDDATHSDGVTWIESFHNYWFTAAA